MNLWRSAWFYGMALALVIYLLVFPFDLALVRRLSGYAGVSLLIMAFLLSGALVSGDRARANSYREGKEERGQRFRATTFLLKLALPTIALYVLLLIQH